MEIIKKEKSNQLVNKLNDYYMNLNPNTRETYVIAINQFFNFTGVGINKINQITKQDLFEYVNELKNKYSGKTINLKISAIRSLFDYISKPNIFTNMTTAEKNILKIKTSNKIKKNSLLNETEIKQIERYCIKMYNKTDRLVYFRNYLIIDLLITSGLRISELINLKYKNIKDINGTYYVRVNGKRNKERDIILKKSLYELIKDYRKRINCNSDYIITKENCKKLNRTELYKMIKRLNKKVLNKSVSPHQLRHSFCNIQLKNTKDLSAVSRYVGHSSTSITADIYIHSELLAENIDITETVNFNKKVS
jgi:integrase/recombinase XerD